MKRVVFLILFVSFASFASAHNQVVVVPLLGGPTASEVPRLRNVITVSRSGGDFRNLSSAINSISSSSANNRFLIVIGPGNYNVTSQIVMKPYVNISGSGRNATVLRSRITSATSSMFLGAGDSVISDLSIEMEPSATFPARSAVNSITGATNLERIDISVLPTSSAPLPPFAVNYDGVDGEITDTHIRTSGVNGGSNTALAASLGTVRINNSELISSSSNSRTVECLECSLLISNTRILSGGGSAVWVGDSSPGAFVEIVRSSLEAFAGVIVRNSPNSVIPIYISQSTLSSRRAVPTISGEQIFCVSSDNGLGRELDNNCIVTTPLE